MITIENITSYEKDNLPQIAATLDEADIHQLVEWLNEKDDNLRYKSFLLLQHRSQEKNDVYPYWDVFVEKFGSENSYQRSLGLMLVAENTRWDDAGKMDGIIDAFLAFCDDEKPITVRQCIQSLAKIIPYKKNLYDKIVAKLISIDVMERKETQRKILLVDILTVLSTIKKQQTNEKIEQYFQNVLTGGTLDAKTKKTILAL